jgi:uncharacterized protein YcbX
MTTLPEAAPNMPDIQDSPAGRVKTLYRYPVKSMLGEVVPVAVFAERGVAGDRECALIDRETGKVASAKNPRRWPKLFAFRAAYPSAVEAGTPLPPIAITFPDGSVLGTDVADISGRLSVALDRPITLARAVPEAATAEGYWPDHDWLPQRDEVFDFPLPSGTFFDIATVHLLTTSTLESLSAAAPHSRFDVARFRPNVVIESREGTTGFFENDWIGKTLLLGKQVRLYIERPCARCVMTTLAQGDLPSDPVVLRTAVHSNGGNVGVYARVVRAGSVGVGDAVRVQTK